jgi:hypothetical protein
MSKNILQDVIPPKKRSIRDVPISSSHKKKKSDTEIENSTNTFNNKDKKPRKIKWLYIFIVFLIIFLVAFSTVFSNAKINITPKQEKVEIGVLMKAVKDQDSIDGVPFKVLSIETDGYKTISSFEEKDIDKKASGEITIFNNYTTSPFRLVATTRFETSEGLVYRTPKSLSVPGKTTEGGKTVPGSITIKVYADVPGEDYNIGLKDFTIPGLKGSDSFNSVYARSKTAMTGGFSGVMKIVGDSDLENMRAEIYSELEEELKNKVYSQVPEDYILYSDGIFVSFNSQENIDLGDSVQVIERGILDAVLFNKQDLSDYIANNLVSSLDEGKVSVINLEDLNFNIKNKQNISLLEDKDFDFDLDGFAQFVWMFDENKMKNDFVGQNKNNINSILANYIGIKEVEVIISPFWKTRFPKNVDRIKIIKNLSL